MFDEGRLTIRVVRLHNAPHDAPHDGLHNSFKEHFLQWNNDVLHSCHIWCQRTAGATTHFPTLFATHQQVINKVMIEHTSNEILTFCIHVGYDISTAADLRFHYSMAKCQYFIILVASHSVVLRIATPAGNPVACALQEIPLPGPCKKSHCLGPREIERERQRGNDGEREREKERQGDRDSCNAMLQHARNERTGAKM